MGSSPDNAEAYVSGVTWGLDGLGHGYVALGGSLPTMLQDPTLARWSYVDYRDQLHIPAPGAEDPHGLLWPQLLLKVGESRPASASHSEWGQASPRWEPRRYPRWPLPRPWDGKFGDNSGVALMRLTQHSGTPPLDL